MRNAYIEVLRKIVNEPIKNPTDDDFKKLCPHLNDAQLEDIRANTNYLLACPPTFIPDCFTYVRYMPVGNIPTLRFAFVSSAEETSFAKEANEYAKENWGEELISNTSLSVVQFLIVNDEEKENSNTKKIFVSLACAWEKVLDKNLKPKSSLINDDILCITSDDFLGEHLQCNREIKKIYSNGDNNGNRIFTSLLLPEKVKEHLLREEYGFSNELYEFKNHSAKMAKNELANF